MRTRLIACFILLVIPVLTSSCSWFRVKQTHRIPISEQALPAKTASLEELVSLVNQSANRIQTLKLTVIYQLTGGSINTGVVSNYRETDGFILVRKPHSIRLIGLAFKVKVFDMVSDGREFFIYVPPKNKFIHGLNSQEIKPRKDLPVNLRPGHIFEALILDPIDPEHGKDLVALEEDQEGKHKFYILTLIGDAGGGMGVLKRRIWIDRFDLSIARQKIYDHSLIVSDISYSEPKEFEGGSYPSLIDFKRPQEDYSLRLRISKAVVNGPLTDEQFVLEQPPGTEYVDLAENP